MDKDKLLQVIEEGNSGHAILFAGAPESDWTLFARRAAARYLLHTDDWNALLESPVFIEVTEFSIDPMRDVLKLLNMEAFQQGRRCVLLVNIHRMSQLIQNVLLKTLEEPPSDTLLLLTGVESGILPTILSRCMIIHDDTEPWETISEKLKKEGIAADKADLCAKRSDGVIGRARVMATEEHLEFRNGAISCFRSYVKGIQPLKEAAQLCTRAEAEEGSDDNRKKARVSAELVDAMFDIWLELLSDVSRSKIGHVEIHNSDCESLVKNLSDIFTMERIQGMINTLFEGKRQLSFRATASMTLDWVLCKLP